MKSSNQINTARSNTKRYDISNLIGFIVCEHEKTAFEAYCRNRGIRFASLVLDDWLIILLSIVELRKQHKERIGQRAKTDEKFAKFISKMQSKYLDEAFNKIQKFLVDMNHHCTDSATTPKTLPTPTKNTFTTWCENFAKQIQLQNTSTSIKTEYQQEPHQIIKTDKTQEILALYQEAIYLYQGMHHLTMLMVNKYASPYRIEELLEENKRRIQAISDKLHMLGVGFDSNLCRIYQVSK